MPWNKQTNQPPVGKFSDGVHKIFVQFSQEGHIKGKSNHSNNNVIDKGEGVKKSG